MKKYMVCLLFFISLISLGYLYGTEREVFKYSSFDEVSREFELIYSLFQKKQHKIYTRIPNVSELQEGELVLSKVGSTVKLYCRIQQSTYSVTLN